MGQKDTWPGLIVFCMSPCRSSIASQTVDEDHIDMVILFAGFLQRYDTGRGFLGLLLCRLLGPELHCHWSGVVAASSEGS